MRGHHLKTVLVYLKIHLLGQLVFVLSIEDTDDAKMDEFLAHCKLRDFEDKIDPLFWTLGYSSLGLIASSFLARNKLRRETLQESKCWFAALLFAVSGVVLGIAGTALATVLRPTCPRYCTCRPITEKPFECLGYFVGMVGVGSVLDGKISIGIPQPWFPS